MDTLNPGQVGSDGRSEDAPSVTVSTSLTTSQLDWLKRKAQEAGMPVEGYLRKLILQDAKGVQGGHESPSSMPVVAREVGNLRTSVDLLRAELERSGHQLRALRCDIPTALSLVLALIPGLDRVQIDEALQRVFPRQG